MSGNRIGTKESNISRQIQLAATQAGHRLWRNQTGAHQDQTGRWIRYGVGGVGGSDLIGISRTGTMIALEVKTPRGRLTPEQAAFLAMVASMGGIAACVRSVEEAMGVLGD